MFRTEEEFENLKTIVDKLETRAEAAERNFDYLNASLFNVWAD